MAIDTDAGNDLLHVRNVKEYNVCYGSWFTWKNSEKFCRDTQCAHSTTLATQVAGYKGLYLETLSQ